MKGQIKFKALLLSYNFLLDGKKLFDFWFYIGNGKYLWTFFASCVYSSSFEHQSISPQETICQWSFFQIFKYPCISVSVYSFPPKHCWISLLLIIVNIIILVSCLSLTPLDGLLNSLTSSNSHLSNQKAHFDVGSLV